MSPCGDCLHRCAAALSCFADVHSLSPESSFAFIFIRRHSLVLCAQLLQQEYKRATDDGTCLKSLVADLSSQRNSAKVCLSPEGITLKCEPCLSCAQDTCTAAHAAD